MHRWDYSYFYLDPVNLVSLACYRSVVLVTLHKNTAVAVPTLQLTFRDLTNTQKVSVSLDVCFPRIS